MIGDGVSTDDTPDADGPTDDTPTADDPTGAQSSPDQGDDTSVPWKTGDDETEGSGDAGMISDIRTGVHETYDRVVVETDGPGAPGWLAQWSETAAPQGKGDPIVLQGEHLLRVYGRGIRWLDPDVYEGYGKHDVGGPALKQVWIERTFEGQFQVVLGADATEYRTFSLSSPTRLVIDVKHPEG